MDDLKVHILHYASNAIDKAIKSNDSVAVRAEMIRAINNVFIRFKSDIVRASNLGNNESYDSDSSVECMESGWKKTQCNGQDQSPSAAPSVDETVRVVAIKSLDPTGTVCTFKSLTCLF